jgi:hypothetical protein
VGAVFGADRGVTTITVPTASYIPVLTIRLKAGQLRRTVVPIFFEIHDTTAAGVVNYRLLRNPTRGAGTAPSWVSADANSSVEYDITSTQAITGGQIVVPGYAQGRSVEQLSTLPDQITLGAQDIAGVVPDEFMLAARTTGGGGGDACLGSCSWVEL